MVSMSRIFKNKHLDLIFDELLCEEMGTVLAAFLVSLEHALGLKKIIFTLNTRNTQDI